MQWIDLSAAKRRLSELETEVEGLRREQLLIHSILDHLGSPSPTRPPPRATRRSSAPPGRRGTRQPLLQFILDALRLAPPEGRTAAEIAHHINANHAERPGGRRGTVLVSAALSQARKAKEPKIRVIKQGGPGVPSTYGVA